VSGSEKFSSRVKSHFDQISTDLFSGLKSGEDLVLGLRGEDSLFVRINQARVRQNTSVEQVELSLRYQAQGRTLDRSLPLTLDFATDTARVGQVMRECRSEIESLPPDPFQVAVVNNGTSDREFYGELGQTEEIIADICGAAKDDDLAGLFAGGPLIAASKNSKGQSHWFSSESFFMDYSLYAGPKAAKAALAGMKWDRSEWAHRLADTRRQLSLLQRESLEVKPGKYRTFLASEAINEILGILSWGALSTASWKQGSCGLQKLIEGQVKLSPRFSLRENFDLGLSPLFNSMGEVSPAQLPLIRDGVVEQLLTSSRSAKEYCLPANAAESYESLRSPEVASGDLEESAILKELGTGLYVSNLHYLNWSDRLEARVTGMTRYACFWVEGGEIVAPIQDLRFDESLYALFGAKLLAVTKNSELHPNTSTYGSRSTGGSRTPGMLVDDMTFTL
jgi:predicted Zn-dependent protease